MAHPVPQIKESTRFNFLTSIWIVPLIALIVAGSLVFQYFNDRGPEIKIVFPKNEGLIAGQSVMKFKNVPIGKVTKIYLDEAVNGVVVVVRMNSKKAIPYLTEKAKFWIVKPEVGFSGISGLDTLLSGTYIDVYSEKGGKHFKEEYFGLEQPYHDADKGSYYHLNSAEGKGVSVGTPVYYKNIVVGKVEYVYLALDNKSVDVIVFIQKAYTPFIHTNSKFWMKNMLDIDFTKGKLDINIAPLNHLVSGGILFSSSGYNEKETIPDAYVFPLFKNKAASEEHTVGGTAKNKKKFIIHTDASLSNLAVDAVVRFDGFNIGKVLDINLSYQKKKHSIVGTVLLEIDTSVFEEKDKHHSTGLENFYQAVQEGLRAKIDILNPITGTSFVNLVFEHPAQSVSIDTKSSYPAIPMARYNTVAMMDTVSEILDKINHLPLETLLESITELVQHTHKSVAHADELLGELKQTIANLNRLTGKKSFEVLPDELGTALEEMSHTLRSTRQVIQGYDTDSLMQKQLRETLKTLTKTSLEMQNFLKMLNRKPNSLIFGDR